MTLRDEVEKAGWDPFNPSAECKAETALFVMSTRLDEMDRFGVFHQILCLKLIVRFARGEYFTDERCNELAQFALVFALLRSDQKHQLTPELVAEWTAELQIWRETRLLPASERLRKCQSEDEIIANLLYVEPAATLAWWQVHLGLVNTEGDQLRMAIGQAMHEEGKKQPCHPAPLTIEELEGYFDFLTREGGNVSRITQDGKIEIDPKLVKQAMDTFDPERGMILRAARREQVERDEAAAQAAKDEQRSMPVPTEASVIAALQSVDAVARAREVVRARLAAAKPGSAKWHVRVNFARLTGSEEPALSVRALAEQIGMDEGAIRRAYNEELEAVRIALAG